MLCARDCDRTRRMRLFDDMSPAMAEHPFNVLFLCTGNSARSIMAEAILNKLGAGKFRAYSAGSQPKGQVHPETARLLQSLGYDTAGFRSKSWGEFARPGAPALDFVFSVCDNAAGETCPVWPGQPMTAHWVFLIRPRQRVPRRRSRWHSRMPTECCINGSGCSTRCPCVRSINSACRPS
jgi:protein-tyrosine-phosphatase